MKIENITLTPSEQDEIFQKLIKDFDLDYALWHGNKIRFDIIFDDLELYCESELNILEDKNDHSRQVIKFELFISHNGDELETNMDLETQIKNYYERT
jgi:hypothetical protein